MSSVAVAGTSTQRRALGALLLGGACIGCSPIFVRLSSVGPLATAFWRLVLALIPLLVWFAHGNRDGQVRRPRHLGEHLIAALPGIFLAGDLAAWQVSLYMTSVANATLLVNMAPIFVTLAGWLLWRQPVSRMFLGGLAMSIAGVLVMKGGAGTLGGGDIRGDATALGSAVFYAGYILLIARARTRFPTTVIMLWSTFAAALCILPLAVLFESAWLPSTVAAWMVLAGLAWISHAGGQSLIAFSLAWLPATFSSLTLLIQPIVAALLAWVLLGEQLTAATMAGGLIVIAGIALAGRR